MPEQAHSLSEQDQKYIWHPYTQMKTAAAALPIVRGKGALLFDEQDHPYIDAISSWWVNIHGHGNSYIAQKIFEQALVLEHCIFAGFTHPQAIELARRLLPVIPGSLSRIFYSDNGSTAVEVALKMAIQYWHNQGMTKRRILALQHAYHGDTFGAMSVSGRSLFTGAFSDYLFEVDFTPIPTQGDPVLQGDPGQYAAVIFEPLVLGSGGMLMYGTRGLEDLIRYCREKGMLVIADEVMTGFGRTGRPFAMDYLPVSADIVCLSKGLTGGTMALGVTACTAQVFDAFLSEDRTRTLFHGHSYMANPIACAAANASLDLFLSSACQENIHRIETLHREFGKKIGAHPAIKDLRQTGTILAFEVATRQADNYTHPLRDYLYEFFIRRRIILRPLGNTLYIMPPYCITDDQLHTVYAAIEELLEELIKKKNILGN